MIIFLSSRNDQKNFGWGAFWNLHKLYLLHNIGGMNCMKCDKVSFCRLLQVNVVTVRFVKEIRNNHRNLAENIKYFSSFMSNCDITYLLLGAKCPWSNRNWLHASIEFWFLAIGKIFFLTLFNRYCQNLHSDICPLMVDNVGMNWVSPRIWLHTLIVRTTNEGWFKELIKTWQDGYTVNGGIRAIV